MTIWQFLDRNIAEIIGVIALSGMFSFAVDYSRFAKWRKHEQGRAVMYLIITLGATILTLIIHGFVPKYDFRWAVEVVVYTPLAVSAFYLRHTLRKTLGLNSRWLVKIPKKHVTDDDELDEDTQPRH